MTIDALRAMPIIGNAYHDRPRFDAANEIIFDPDQSFDDRVEAMREVDRTMGEPSDDLKTPEQQLAALRQYHEFVGRTCVV